MTSHLQTPGQRRFGPRPSSSNGNLKFNASSFRALTGESTTPSDSDAGREITVGCSVDVPGGMTGTVKFIGSVRGKKGTFAGVELSKEYAGRGKNDGDVDGIRYFTTTIPGAGIFLPVHRATVRDTPDFADATFPSTPSTPPFPSFNFGPRETQTPPPQSIPKLSQSVGPGVRPTSPLFKPKGRPSLPRPESPYRSKPGLAPSGRGAAPGANLLSKSQIGTPRFTPSPAPRTQSPAKTKTPQPARPYSRNNSRLGFTQSIDESTETTPLALARSSDGSAVGSGISSGSGFTPVPRALNDEAQEEIKRLKDMLEERNRQLKEQAAQLAEMETSFAELQDLIPMDGLSHGRSGSKGSLGDADNAQLRAIIREKNEKISLLTAEFDAHRADFRSTIDTLEMASTETERVYEKRVEELMQEVRELQEGREDVANVAQQLKQLEELVQELEEGLEDARRGEAEARGEVEFLRGEVERGRSELRREREKATEALKNANASVQNSSKAGQSRDLEQRDDEIRGLKAIIHSLSSGGGDMGTPELAKSLHAKNRMSAGSEAEEVKRLQATVERLEREKKDLQGLVERKAYREEELEHEIKRLTSEARGSVISNPYSERTATQEKRTSERNSKGTAINWRGSSGAVNQELPNVMETESAPSTIGSGVLWCEICETNGHDILTCTSMDKPPTPQEPPREVSPKSTRLHSASISSQDPDKPKPLLATKKPSLPPLPGAAPTAPLPSPYEASLVAGKDGSRPDPNKWCALCERDGHDSINCAFEDQF